MVVTVWLDLPVPIGDSTVVGAAFACVRATPYRARTLRYHRYWTRCYLMMIGIGVHARVITLMGEVMIGR